MQHTNPFPWQYMLWSTVVLFAIPTFVTMLVSVGYGVMVGFQTRGDSEAINQAVIAINTADWFQVLPFALAALVAVWRGILGQELPLGAALVALVLAALLAALLFLLLVVVLGQSMQAALSDAALRFCIAALVGSLMIVLRGQRTPSPA